MTLWNRVPFSVQRSDHLSRFAFYLLLVTPPLDSVFESFHFARSGSYFFKLLQFLIVLAGKLCDDSAAVKRFFCQNRVSNESGA